MKTKTRSKADSLTQPPQDAGTHPRPAVGRKGKKSVKAKSIIVHD
jgi:hypothetical protein